MMDCKKALTETNGDIGAAIENMRKNGQAKAAKKRVTSLPKVLSSSKLMVLLRLLKLTSNRLRC